MAREGIRLDLGYPFWLKSQSPKVLICYPPHHNVSHFPKSGVGVLHAHTRVARGLSGTWMVGGSHTRTQTVRVGGWTTVKVHNFAIKRVMGGMVGYVNACYMNVPGIVIF